MKDPSESILAIFLHFLTKYLSKKSGLKPWSHLWRVSTVNCSVLTIKISIHNTKRRFVRLPFPAGNNMFKVNNRNTRTRCEICSKLTAWVMWLLIFPSDIYLLKVNNRNTITRWVEYLLTGVHYSQTRNKSHIRQLQVKFLTFCKHICTNEKSVLSSTTRYLAKVMKNENCCSESNVRAKPM